MKQRLLEAMQVDPREEYQKALEEKRNAKKSRIQSVMS